MKAHGPMVNPLFPDAHRSDDLLTERAYDVGVSGINRRATPLALRICLLLRLHVSHRAARPGRLRSGKARDTAPSATRHGPWSVPKVRRGWQSRGLKHFRRRDVRPPRPAAYVLSGPYPECMASQGLSEEDRAALWKQYATVYSDAQATSSIRSLAAEKVAAVKRQLGREDDYRWARAES